MLHNSVAVMKSVYDSRFRVVDGEGVIREEIVITVFESVYEAPEVFRKVCVELDFFGCILFAFTGCFMGFQEGLEIRKRIEIGNYRV